MMKHENFVAFIMTHGRPNKVLTYNTLRKHNYTGKIYVVIDNEDDTAEEYYENYGEQVIMFDKLEMSKKFDTADTFDNRKTVVYARNVCFELAKKVGADYFLELDDDYTTFSYRKEVDGKLLQKPCKQLDKVFDLMLDFLDSTDAKMIAFAQAGDFIGGIGSKVWSEKLSRKAMNAIFIKTDNPFNFVGRINEDVNTYTTLGSKGERIFTICNVMINQLLTQTNAGGMTDVYKENGTYVKSFYSVIFSPSCVKISSIGGSGNGHMFRRIHHRISWNNCVPKILSEKVKKTS